MAKVTSRDLYLNFVALETAIDAANSSTLVEVVLNTGLSIRGGLVWLIHLVELFVRPPGSQAAEFSIALVTRQGLAAMPRVGDDGVICKVNRTMTLITSGMVAPFLPSVLHYLPPIPIACPQISLYCAENADVSGDRGVAIEGRVGFTTTPLDSAVYTEIAEAWGW